MNSESMHNLLNDEWLRDTSSSVISGLILLVPTVIFFVAKWIIEINDGTYLDVTEPSDTSKLDAKWIVKSTGSKPLYVSKVVGYPTKVKTSKIQPGESFELHSLFGTRGGVIFYRRFKHFGKSRQRIFGDQTAVPVNSKGRANKNESIFKAARILKKLMQSSSSSQFDLKGSISQHSDYKSFYISAKDEGFNKALHFIRFYLNTDLEVLLKTAESYLKTHTAKVVNDEGYWKFHWKLTRKELNNVRRSLIWKSLTSKLPTVDRLVEPHAFLRSISLNQSSPGPVIKALRLERPEENEYVSVAVNSGKKIIAIGNGVHFDVSIRSNIYKKDHAGFLMNVRTREIDASTMKERSRKDRLFVGKNGVVIHQDSKKSSVRYIKLGAKDTELLLDSLINWNAW